MANKTAPTATNATATTAPTQEDMNSAFLAALQSLDERLTHLSAAHQAAPQDQQVAQQVAQQQAQQLQQAQQIAYNATSILFATQVAKNKSPITAKRDELLLGTDPRSASIFEAARRAADVEAAYAMGIVREPDREGLSPWAIAGIAVGAAAVGAGAAVGISYLLNKEGGES